jgi:hypothetical protein
MKAAVVFIVFLFFLHFANPAFALDLIINEFLSNPSSGSQEWVEFYNTSNSSIDMSDYYFDDDTNFDSDSGSSTKIALSGILPTLQACYWELSGYLNNNGDFPTLFKAQNEASTLIDTYAYASSSAGFSYARVPDGGSWSILQNPTQASNKCTDLAPTSIPTPNPTSTPTNTPTPTSSPTNTPTPTKTPTPTSMKSPTPTSKSGPMASSAPENTAQSSVLGENAGGELGIPDQTKKPDTVFQWTIMLLGIALIAICVIFTIRIIKKGELGQDEKE